MIDRKSPVSFICISNAENMHHSISYVNDKQYAKCVSFKQLSFNCYYVFIKRESAISSYIQSENKTSLTVGNRRFKVN